MNLEIMSPTQSRHHHEGATESRPARAQSPAVGGRSGAGIVCWPAPRFHASERGARRTGGGRSAAGRPLALWPHCSSRRRSIAASSRCGSKPISKGCSLG